PEEAPVHTSTVAAFAVERHPVTNAQVAEFVAATGYVTVAELAPDPALYPRSVAIASAKGVSLMRARLRGDGCARPGHPATTRLHAGDDPRPVRRRRRR